MELRYCPECYQMTNHRIIKHPLFTEMVCLKCEK